jgi:hypothetical protein
VAEGELTATVELADAVAVEVRGISVGVPGTLVRVIVVTGEGVERTAVSAEAVTDTVGEDGSCCAGAARAGPVQAASATTVAANSSPQRAIQYPDLRSGRNRCNDLPHPHGRQRPRWLQTRPSVITEHPRS